MVEFQVWEFENLDFFIFHSRNLRSVLNCRKKLTESCKTSHLTEKKGGGGIKTDCFGTNMALEWQKNWNFSNTQFYICVILRLKTVDTS